MRRGRLRHLIGIYAVSETREDDGTLSEATSLLAKSWASATPEGGTERAEAATSHPEVTVVFRMPWLSGVTARHRVFWSDRWFDIRAALNVDERSRELELHCTERT